MDAAREVDPDVIVLDLGLPTRDGIEVCRQIRTFSDAYVVMLTARNDEVDTLIGLSVGADDYVIKPFSPRELMARSHAMFRRPRATGTAADAQNEVRTFGPLTIEPVAGTCGSMAPRSPSRAPSSTCSPRSPARPAWRSAADRTAPCTTDRPRRSPTRHTPKPPPAPAALPTPFDRVRHDRIDESGCVSLRMSMS